MATWHNDSFTLTTSDAELMAALDWAVEDRGAGYIYPDGWRADGGCTYVTPDRTGPACLIGTQLTHLGVPVQVLAGFPDVDVRDLFAEITVVREDGSGQVTDRDPITRAMAEAQARQDNGRTWGYALAGAKIEYDQLRRAGLT